jgi:hypothetical protein
MAGDNRAPSPIGRSEMTRKADFNAEDWERVVEGPLLAGMRVVAADRGGTIRESLAMGQAYAHARQQQGESELLDELVSAPPAMDPNRLRDGGDLAAKIDSGLRDAVRLVEQKASPEEVDAYKGFVVTVAEAVANAHREGGFLGIGGKPVSDSERAAIDEIKTTLEAT